MVELTWQGKYTPDGKRAAPLRLALPFQTIETVNESAQERHKALDLFSAGHPAEWRNRLIWGDRPAAPCMQRRHNTKDHLVSAPLQLRL